MKIVKTMVNKASSVIVAVELFDKFMSRYQGNITQVSGPHLTLSEGRSGIPDYIVSGSIIIEDEGDTLNE